MNAAAARHVDYDALIQEAHAMRSAYIASAAGLVLKAVFAPFARVIKRQGLRNTFQGMDARMLQDIGLAPGDIEYSVNICVPHQGLAGYIADVAAALQVSARANAERAALSGLNPHLRRDIGLAEKAQDVRPVSGSMERIVGGLADPQAGDQRIANDFERRAAA